MLRSLQTILVQLVYWTIDAIKMWSEINKLLKTLLVAGIDLIDQQVDSSQALHRLKYLNIKDLFIHIRYIHLENIDLQSLTTGMWQVF